MGELQQIDPVGKKVSTGKGTLDYDIFAVAMETVTNFFGNQKVQKYASVFQIF
ncbi:hypothetical protein [Pedobacter sp. P26]|uniref:hypothetical protein n=1 Tax=Pedobacter sp. P26 TaxID=3423956 RepID=UPI003D6735A2